MSNNDRLNVIKKELNDLLEEKIGNLLGVVRATQQVTRELIATEEEIRRQTYVRERLETELGPASRRSDSVENKEVQARLERLNENVERMKALRDELMTNLSNLKGGIEE